MRLLRTDEYIQMAGRAGRRGKDTIGHVFYIPEHEPVSLDEIQQMMKGGKPRVESRMDFGYDFLLKTLNSGDRTWLNLLERSYWFRQLEQMQCAIKKDIKKLGAEIDAIKLTEDEIKAIDEKKSIQQTIACTQNAKKRDAQRALERWNDVHIGQRWFTAEENYKKKTILIKEHKMAENNLINSENAHLLAINTKLDYLVSINFLDQDKKILTPRGMAATEFNEGQPILCTELAFRNTLGHLSTDDFVTCLACFVNDSDKDEQPALVSLALCDKVKDALGKIGALALELGQKEYDLTKKDTRFWDLNTTWLEPVSAWLSGSEISKICVDYGIFEGNFVRTVMRLANLVDEWIAVATLIEDIELLEKLREVRGRLVKDVIIPDSLYLHI
jgi:superfamily II RNA helicase